jgi:ATP-dependent DNA ligase
LTHLSVLALELPCFFREAQPCVGLFLPSRRVAAFRRKVLGKLKPLQVQECPFANLPDTDVGRWGAGITADHMREMHWTKPQLVAQIRFVEWTAENRLRHAAFLGLRLDKSAREVRREP